MYKSPISVMSTDGKPLAYYGSVAINESPPEKRLELRYNDIIEFEYPRYQGRGTTLSKRHLRITKVTYDEVAGYTECLDPLLNCFMVFQKKLMKHITIDGIPYYGD